MKNRHIIASALLLLTTTAAAQDRHTETAPDTGENLQTAPNAEQLRQQIETLQRQLDLLEKGQDTLAAKKPALLSDPVEPIANMNGIIPLDTLQTINEAVKIVIYNDNSWKYVRDREFVKDSSIYTKYWDTSTLFPYKEYPLSEMPASLAIDLVDSLKCYHYPYKGSIRSKYGIRYRRRHQGVDIPVKTGDPIYATFDGRVRISEYNRGGYGNLIIVRHDNGLETYYGHLSERLVQSGEWVEAGQIIGLGGSTGRSTGPHLHFETRYYGQAFDPERLIDFESGILRRQTFLLKKSFFDIRVQRRTGFRRRGGSGKGRQEGGCGKSRRNLPYDQVGRYARRSRPTVRHDGIEALFAQRYQIDHDPAARTQAPGPLNKQTSRNRAGCGMKLAPYRMMRLRKQIIK